MNHIMQLGIVRWIRTHQFAIMVTMASIIAVIMTGISLVLYWRSGAIKLDLSRPGYEKVRKTVQDNSVEQPFSSNGAVDQAAIDDFNKRLNGYQEQLKQLGDYKSASISDDDLGLTKADEQEVSQRPVLLSN